MYFVNKLNSLNTYDLLRLLTTVLNGGSNLFVRLWSPSCSNWNYHQVHMGGVTVRITKIILLSHGEP